MSTLFFFGLTEIGQHNASMECSLIPHPPMPVVLPLCANCVVSTAAEERGVPIDRSILGILVSHFCFDGYLGSSTEEDAVRDQVKGSTDLQKRGSALTHE